MNRIKEVREEKGLTQAAVSDALKIPQNTLSQYENAKREPKLETWKKLADYFNVGILYLQGVTTTQDKQSDEQVKSAFKDMIDYFKKDDTAKAGEIFLNVLDVLPETSFNSISHIINEFTSEAEKAKKSQSGGLSEGQSRFAIAVLSFFKDLTRELMDDANTVISQSNISLFDELLKFNILDETKFASEKDRLRVIKFIRSALWYQNNLMELPNDKDREENTKEVVDKMDTILDGARHGSPEAN